MKGFRIAINILLVLDLLLWIACIILIPTALFPAMTASLGEGAESSQDFGEALGGAIGAGFMALFMLMICFVLMVMSTIAALTIIPVIIVYNVSKYPKLGVGIVVLILVSVPAGILMLIQRSKYLNMQNSQVLD